MATNVLSTAGAAGAWELSKEAEAKKAYGEGARILAALQQLDPRPSCRQLVAAGLPGFWGPLRCWHLQGTGAMLRPTILAEASPSPSQNGYGRIRSHPPWDFPWVFGLAFGGVPYKPNPNATLEGVPPPQSTPPSGPLAKHEELDLGREPILHRSLGG
jgi:hypothetical protein